MKLKASQIKSHRETVLRQQNGCCLLCGELIDESDAVLDHNHQNGKVRGVLHRGCNVIEGVIANNSIRNKITKHRLQRICQNLIKYLSSSDSEFIHPTFKTAEEKRALAAKRRKRRLPKTLNNI